MSRHRDVRNLESDDLAQDDYGSSYGSSYCDEVSLSTSVEREYMYRRNTGMSPKLSHFYGRSDSVGSIPEEDDTPSRRPYQPSDSDDESSSVSPHSGRRHSSVSCLLEALSDEDQSKLAKCLETILDIVGESMPEIQVKETIIRCNFDTELSLNTLLNNPIGAYHECGMVASANRTGAASLRKRNEPRGVLDPQPTPWSPPAPSELSDTIRHELSSGKAELFLEETDATLCAESTSNDQFFNGKLNDDAGNDSDDNSSKVTEKSTTNNIFMSPTPTAVSKLKGNRLKIRSRSPSPFTSTPNKSKSHQQQPDHSNSLNTTSSLNNSTTLPGSAIKMRKKEVVPREVYNSERGTDANSKDLLNLVVVGHVDSGKSTLMGHLLVELGQVSSRIMHKYESESRKVGKGSFAYAWVLDETNEERERGITMDVGHSAFQTKSKSVTLLDAPGHKDFIPNMISGAYQADVAILVVNATRGEFEAGFDQGGQTREHALLVRSLGVSQLIIAVNKLDTIDWSKERFDEIVAKLGKFLKTQVGFKDSDISFVPVSGLTGANLSEPNNSTTDQSNKEDDKRHLLFEWYSGPSLIQGIDNLRSPPRLIDKPFRMSISDLFKPTSGGGGGFCAAGRIETGYIQKSDTVLISPLNEYATVKNISLDNALPSSTSQGLNCAFAGDHVSLTLAGTGSGSSLIDPANLALGMIVCDPSQPVKVSKHFAAKLVVLNIDTPITKGFACVLHYGGVTEAAVLKKLVAQVSKGTGEIVKRKPRILAKNSSAQVEITTESPVCIERYAESKELGRFMLRAGGKTIAAGMITDIF